MSRNKHATKVVAYDDIFPIMSIFKIGNLPNQSDIDKLKNYVHFSLFSIQSQQITIKNKNRFVINGLCRLTFLSRTNDVDHAKIIDIYSIPERDHIFDDTNSLIIKPYSLPLRKNYNPKTKKVNYNYAYPFLGSDLTYGTEDSIVSSLEFFGFGSKGVVKEDYKLNHEFEEYEVENINLIRISYPDGRKTYIKSMAQGKIGLSLLQKRDLEIEGVDIYGRKIIQHF